MNATFFIFLAYSIVLISIAIFMYYTFRQRKHFLVKLEEEGFFVGGDENLSS